MSIIVITNTVKQWACAIEYILQNKDEVHTVLDFWNLATLMPKSIQMKKIEKKIGNAKFLKFKKRHFFNYRVFKKSVTFCKQIKSHNNLDFQLIYYGVNIVPILKNIFSEKQKTANFKIYKMSRKAIFWQVYRIVLTINFLYYKNITSEKLFLYNGRDLINGSVLSFSVNKKQNYSVFERASGNRKYVLFKRSPQDNTEWWEKIMSFECTNLMSDSKDSYIINKAKGYDPVAKKDWRIFFDTESNLENLNFGKKKYIVYFSSSTFEHSVIETPDQKIGFKNQFEAVSILIQEAQSLGMTLVIRRHPNSATKDGVDNERLDWESILTNEIIYFGPESRVNSYELASKAYCSFVFKSSIGFDLICNGLPVFALGPAKWAFHSKFQCFDRNRLHQTLERVAQGEILSEIVSERIEVINRYACYYANYGDEYKNFVFVERWGCRMTQGPIVYKFFMYRQLFYLSHPFLLIRKLVLSLNFRFNSLKNKFVF